MSSERFNLRKFLADKAAEHPTDLIATSISDTKSPKVWDRNDPKYNQWEEIAAFQKNEADVAKMAARQFNDGMQAMARFVLAYILANGLERLTVSKEAIERPSGYTIRAEVDEDGCYFVEAVPPPETEAQE